MERHAARFPFNFMTANQKSVIGLSVIYTVFIYPTHPSTALYNYFILPFSQTSNTFSPVLTLGLIFLPISLRQLKQSQVLRISSSIYLQAALIPSFSFVIVDELSLLSHKAGLWIVFLILSYLFYSRIYL